MIQYLYRVRSDIIKSKKLIILGHENPDIDSIVSGILLEYYINKNTKKKAKFIIPDKEIDEDTINICNKFNIPYKDHLGCLPCEFIEIILVDHFERDIKNSKIIAIIDHHPTTKKINANFYINEKISSTAALITQNNEQYFSKDMLKLAVLATYIDTASFNSTKAQEKDKIWAEEICSKYNFNKDAFYEAGLMLTDLNNLEKAAFTCLKKYNINNKKIEVSSIQINGNNTKEETINNIKEIVINYFLNNNLDIYILIIHDMSIMKTTSYKIFKDGIVIEKYDKYTSRGNVIIPKLEKEISSHNFETNKINLKK